MAHGIGFVDKRHFSAAAANISQTPSRELSISAVTKNSLRIDNGIVFGTKPIDVQKILNLKRAREFILDKGEIAEFMRTL